MKGFSYFEPIDMVADDYFNLSGQHINKFFTFVLVSHSLVVLHGFNGNLKRFQMFILGSRRKGGIGIILGTFGIGLDPVFQARFLLSQEKTGIDIQSSGEL